jgi:hypothetical protein
MFSFVSKTLGRLAIPTLEKDLANAVNESLKSSATLTDCFLPPAVYAFEKQPVNCGYYGIGHATCALERRIATATTPAPTFEKVNYSVPARGLFR